MVKVKRIVHLENKNIAEHDNSTPAKGDSAAVQEAPKASSAEVKGGLTLKQEAATPAKEKNEIDDERRSTRKIKKKRQYGEEEGNDDFSSLLGDDEDSMTGMATPIKNTGIKSTMKKALATPTSTKKRVDVGLLDDSSMDTPPGKRPRLARGTPKAAVTPKRPPGLVSPLKKDSPLKKEDSASLSGTPAENVANPSSPPPPPAPKEKVTFKAGCSNPAGLQSLIDFLIKVLKRKDIHGFFAHPPTETLLPGYFARVEIPMDFELIQQKYDAGLYKDLPTFRADAMLMLENAMKYFDTSSVTYHAARKLRHFIRKTTAKDRLLGMKLAFPALMADIGVAELGLDEADLTSDESAGPSSAVGAKDDDGNLVVEIEEPKELLADEELKIEWILKEKEEKGPSTTRTPTKSASKAKTPVPVKRAPFSDNATSQEILTSWINGVGNAGRKSSTPITNPATRGNIQPLSALSRRDRAQGLTSLAILNPDNAAVHVDPNGEALYRPQISRGDNSSASAAISLKQTLNRLPPNSSSSMPTGAIAGFKEDRRNMLKPVKYIGALPFCSYGPSYDSKFANISKGDSDQLVSSFHSEDDLAFGGEIKKTVGKAMGGNDDFELDAVDNFIDAISGGDYLKKPEVVKDRKEFEEAEDKLRKMFSPTTTKETSSENAASTTMTSTESKEFNDLLGSAASQIESLHSAQMKRLSRPPPPHLGLVAKPSKEELGFAEGVTSLLSTMAKKVTPEYLVSQRAIMEALGVDLDWEPVGKAASDCSENQVSSTSEEGGKMRLSAPTTPVAKAEVPQNVFARTFNSAISFVAS